MIRSKFLFAYSNLRKEADAVNRRPTYPTTIPLWRGGSLYAVADKLGYPAQAVLDANRHLLGKPLKEGQPITLPWGGRYNNYRHPRSGRVLRFHPNYRPQVTPEFLDTIEYLESTSGKYRKGDIINGTAYSSGNFHIRKVFPKELNTYNQKRRGKHKTYSSYIDFVNDGFSLPGKPIYSLDDRDKYEVAREIVKHHALLRDHNYFVKHGKYMPRPQLYGGHNGTGEKARDYGQRAVQYENRIKKPVVKPR